MKPLVSILIPAFNAEECIAQTLCSAVGQTWDRKEIIVVDDGSTDRTLSIAWQFAANGVQVFSQANQGAAAARNEAFRRCRGEYVQWLDADDLLAPDKIARQLEERRSERTLLSSGWGGFLYRHSRARFAPTPLWTDLTPVEWLLRKLEFGIHMQTATWLVSRELTEAAGPWNTRLLGDDDGEYFCRVLMASDGVRFVPDAKVYYRQSDNSRLSYIGRSDRKIEAHWRSMQLHINYIRSLEESERVRRACISYLQIWLPHFYPERADILREAEQLAEELGGYLQPPTLTWKYSWIRRLFGWSVAKRAQLEARSLRWSLQRSWDKGLFRLENAWPGKKFGSI